MNIRYIDELDIGGKRVFLRADLNVPLDAGGEVADDTRIQAVAPTIRYALRMGARVILASHLGRPKAGSRDPRLSMTPVSACLAEILRRDVVQAPEVISDGVKIWVNQMKDGDIMVLENLRYHAGEKENDPELARAFSEFSDVYINDAFGSSHRAHASIAALPKLVPDRGAGFLMRKELQYFSLAMDEPARPVTAILGGAKVADKVGIIVNLLKKIDTLLVGGALAYTFLKQMGEEVGASPVEAGKLQLVRGILRSAAERDVKVLMPVDHVAAEKKEPGATTRLVSQGGFAPEEMGLDIGPKTREIFAEIIGKSKTVIWNGPMGVFEIREFSEGTFAVAHAVARCEGLSLVGGGDSAAAVRAAGVADKISHLSTGGGALLQLLEGKVLPGLAALEE